MAIIAGTIYSCGCRNRLNSDGGGLLVLLAQGILPKAVDGNASRDLDNIELQSARRRYPKTPSDSHVQKDPDIWFVLRGPLDV